MSKSPSKLKNSKTTGSALVEQKQSSAIGAQHGATGSCEPPKILQSETLSAVATPEAAAECRQWLQGLNKRPLKDLSEIDAIKIEQAIEWLSRPSPRNWLSGKIVSLLSHYFITQTDERVAKAAAEDWIEILQPCPPWAVSNACRAYLKGQDRRKKPLPGDIYDLAIQQAEFISAANSFLSAHHRSKQPVIEVEKQKPISPEERERIGKRMSELAKSLGSGASYDRPPEPSVEEKQKAADGWVRDAFGTASDALLSSPLTKNENNG